MKRIFAGLLTAMLLLSTTMPAIDNHAKVPLDSLQGHAYNNDGQIMDLHLSMRDDKRNPGVTVTVIPA